MAGFLEPILCSLALVRAPPADRWGEQLGLDFTRRPGCHLPLYFVLVQVTNAIWMQILVSGLGIALFTVLACYGSRTSRTENQCHGRKCWLPRRRSLDWRQQGLEHAVLKERKRWREDRLQGAFEQY
jgi:hypothetical protein